MSTLLEVTNENFEHEVLNSDTTVLVDFWAPWCGPCRVQSPILEELEKELRGKAKIVKLNTDDNFEIATHYGIQAIPTLILFKGGKPVERLVGLQSKQFLLSRLTVN